MDPVVWGRQVWRSVGRVVGLAPTEEWRCGDSWNTDLFNALERGRNTRLMRYRAGRMEWERDARRQRHEFNCHCLELLLQVPPLPNLPSRFPASFARALEVKRAWVRGQCPESRLEQVVDEVANDIRHEFPSNWCFGINARIAGNQVARSALERRNLSLATFLCARNLAMFHGYRSACAAVGCTPDQNAPVLHPVRESPAKDPIEVRAMLCPHLENGELEQAAIQTFDAVVSDWNQRLSTDFVQRITPSSGQPFPGSSS